MSTDATWEMFWEEAGELLRECEAAMLGLEQTPADPELVNRIFRAIHTLKGTSSMLGLDRLADFAHAVEDVLGRIRKGTRVLTPATVDTLLASLDVLGALLQKARAGDGEEPERLAATRERLNAHADEPSVPATPESIVDAGPSDSAGGLFAPVAGDESERQETIRPAEAATLRVPIQKIDRLVNLVGELIITHSMVARLVAANRGTTAPPLDDAIAQMDRHVRELQDRVMAVRMLPIRTIVSRLPRMVRDLAQAQGKQVVLTTVGEDTELDKGIIERISDPLTHLVRNAIDHAIETPEVRRSAGKPAEGRVRIAAFHEGGNVHVELSDDGRGLDREQIRRHALELGWLSPQAQPSDEELFGFIFRPGFSTAGTISQVSGRGVGLDVVLRNVAAMGGAITVHTEPGRGTTFHITLPLTLAILDGQALRVGAQTYLLPLAAIAESLRPRDGEVRHVLGDGEVVIVREQVLPLIRLHRLFDVAGAIEDPAHGVVVIVEHAGRPHALLLDELGDQQQVVLKSLEANFQKVLGLSGATILSDGRVAMILDIPGLVTLSRSQGATTMRTVASRM